MAEYTVRLDDGREFKFRAKNLDEAMIYAAETYGEDEEGNFQRFILMEPDPEGNGNFS